MKIFSSADEVVEAIETCEDKAEVNLALRALIALGAHDKGIDKDDYLMNNLSGQVLLSVMMLAVKNF